MNTEDKIALIKKHSLNPDADYSDSWILKLLDEMEYRSQINLLVRLESAVGRMMILHENKWIEVDDYRQQLSNPFKKLTAYDESIRSVSTDHTEPLKDIKDKPDFPEWIKSKSGVDCMQWPVTDPKYLHNRLFWAFDAGRDCVWYQYLNEKKQKEAALKRIEELEKLIKLERESNPNKAPF